LGDGEDSYSIVTTVRDAEGDPITGVGGRVTVEAPDGVVVGSIVDKGDGTYSFPVSSAIPGNYEIAVLLDGVPVGAPVPVNFIGATIVEPSREQGEPQSATGLGFRPGEPVTVTVHSTPIVVGTFTADDSGQVTAPFTVPNGFELGDHTVEFTGAESGTVDVPFVVVAPGGSSLPPSPSASSSGTASGDEPSAPTGGIVQSSTVAPAVAGVLLLAAGLMMVRLRKQA
jgi:hypothetical protein